MPMFPSPYDLDLFPFTPNDDEVLVDDTVDIDGTTPFRVLGIFNESDTDTQNGDDIIEGRLSGVASPSPTAQVVGVYNFEPIDMGKGNDTLRGEVDYTNIGFNETGFYGLSSGVPVEIVDPITMGDGNDVVEGIASVEGFSEMTVGIGNTDIDTGRGNDDVLGSASVVGNLEADIFNVFGINNSQIATDRGNDDVIGSATVDADASVAAFNVFGISGGTAFNEHSPFPTVTLVSEAYGPSTSIDTGKGRDLVEGTADVSAAFVEGVGGIVGNNLVLDGIDGLVPRVLDNGDGWLEGGLLPIDTGASNDDVIGAAEVTILDNVESSFGINGIAGVYANTSKGSDFVEGTADVTMAAPGVFVSGVNGIANSHIMTEQGSDTVSGSASVEITEGSAAISINGLCNVHVSTGDSSDVVEGFSTVTGDFQSSSSGVGILFCDIDTGNGNDSVTGVAMTASLESSTVGIRDTEIRLGDGNDDVFARGNFRSVDNVVIDGEGGDDTFDLSDGEASVDGGGDDDLLILSGDKDDFDFVLVAARGPTAGKITDASTGGFQTNMDVINIEEFQFDDGTCTFDELFFGV